MPDDRVVERNGDAVVVQVSEGGARESDPAIDLAAHDQLEELGAAWSFATEGPDAEP